MFQKSIYVVLLTLFTIFAPSISVHAEQGQPSVTECMENPTKCEDTNVPSGDEKSTTSASTTISSWDFFKMIFAFVFVIGLLFILLKFLNKRNQLLQSNNMVQNLGGVNVGSNKSVQVVKVGNEVFVVGVGDNVQLLSKLSSEEKKEIIQKYAQVQTSQSDVSTIFPNIVEKWTKRNSHTDHTPTNFKHLLKEEMNEMAVRRQKVLHELERDK
ncbi:flagellar biosynthetic protein FliO [Bacillus sp. CGMCC 1.16541]|uniref:flagellar biosynthetic protein FliO n=1 Tax=Bacillus sp. CGMCC 1.16541 TaxID=2185143 RepID=UPI000D72B8A4|nr:flagellar biosynthetic protein FliO [Bacillus sp. CGMCC 1.16541]